jgi:hypothetical protein
MDTQIFNLGLSVYASSAYIVVCSLCSDGLPPNAENLAARWGADPASLETAIDELLAWRVLEIGQSPQGERIYSPNPASLWRSPNSQPTP